MWTLLLDNWRFVGGIDHLWGPLIPIFKAKFYPSKHCHFEIPIAFQKKAGRRCKLYGRLGSMLDSMLYNDCNMQSVRFKNSKRVLTGYFIERKMYCISYAENTNAKNYVSIIYMANCNQNISDILI